jgi:hypothetical protein
MINPKIRDASSAQRKEADNIRKIAVTIETVLEELAQSGRKLSKSSKGHRALLRDTLETAQRIIVKFLDDETLQKQLVRALKEKRGLKESSPFSWPLEIVAKATGASSRKARKLASKRAGVLEFLRVRDVPVKDTAATLKKEGLEKLYSEWCKKKKETETPAAASAPPPTPDRQVGLVLWMERSDRDQLLNQEVGTKLTMLVSRVSESDGDFQVKRVMVVDGLGEEADEWEE